MARVARERVLIVDTVFMGDDIEAARRFRDPSHVCNYTEAEWRAFVDESGLVADDVRCFDHTYDSPHGSRAQAARATRRSVPRRSSAPASPTAG